MADVLKTQSETRKNSEKRLEDSPPRSPDRDNPLTGWTAQHGPLPPQAHPRDKVAAWQLPDPAAARRANVPVLDIPAYMVADDDDDGMGGGDVPEERMTRDGEELLEQHPGDVPTVEQLREARGVSPEAPADPDDDDENDEDEVKDPTPEPPPNTREDEAPSRNASKEDWLRYARASGYDGDDNITKSDLVERYGA